MTNENSKPTTEILPDPWDNLGPWTGLPADDHVFFVSSFDRLEQVGVSRRTGKPLMNRGKRTWGWFSTFEEALEIVRENITDIHEFSYPYAMIEGVPSGMSAMPTREWWWMWSKEQERWLPSKRPDDFKNIVGLTIG